MVPGGACIPFSEDREKDETGSERSKPDGDPKTRTVEIKRFDRLCEAKMEDSRWLSTVPVGSGGGGREERQGKAQEWWLER